MPTEVRLPQWSMGMAEGTVAAWFKRVGDTVAEGEELAEIEERGRVFEEEQMRKKRKGSEQSEL